MSNIVSNHILNTTDVSDSPFPLRGVAPKMEMQDGFSMSVQASRSHYCSPRDNMGPWYKFEVGYPSHKEELLAEYAEDRDKLTDTVYGYVPLEIILAIIGKHGGLKE